MKIAVVGLGYVGLPLAVELGKKFTTAGLDSSPEKVAAYRNFIDPTGEVSAADLRSATLLTCHTDPEVLSDADKLKPGGVFIDIKSAYSVEIIEKAGFALWRL